MKALVLLFVCLVGPVFGTSVKEKSLEELVAEADHVVVGTVMTVKMYNGLGFETRNPRARTGPGGSNELRWRVKVERAGVLFTRNAHFPEELTIRLWKKWHMTRAGAESHEGKTYVLLLKGDEMRWVCPQGFYRDPGELDAIKELLEAKLPNAAAASGEGADLAGSRGEALRLAELKANERAVVTYSSAGCFHALRRLYTIHGGADKNFEVGHFEASGPVTKTGAAVVNLIPKGSVTLTEAEASGLDRLLEFYRAKPGGYCTTIDTIDVVYWRDGQEVGRETFVDGSCTRGGPGAVHFERIEERIHNFSQGGATVAGEAR